MKKTRLTYLLLAGVSTSASIQADQIVSPTNTSTQYLSPAETVSYSAIYNVSYPQTNRETGLGLRVHYDSSQLTPDNTLLYRTGAQPIGGISADTEDFDTDPKTDHYFVLAWVDLNTQWPGTNTLPLDLFTTAFITQPTFSGTTTINLTASGTAENDRFRSAPKTYCAKPELSIAANAATVTEVPSLAAEFIISAAQPIPSACDDLTINYTFSGSATRGDDYTPLPTQLTLPAGQERITIPLNIIDDDAVENTENIVLTLKDNADYHLAAAKSATISIYSEDTPPVILSTPTDDGKVEPVQHPVPTVSEWMLILISLLLGVCALFNLSRSGRKF